MADGIAGKRVELKSDYERQVALSFVAGKYRVSFVAGKYRVSTVRLNSKAVAMDRIFSGFGIGHGPTSTDTYETMVFNAGSDGEPGDWSDLDCERTTDLEQAKRNHEAVCAKWEVL